nr:TonB-dependent receptor [Hyphomonas sp. Mor2]
MKSERQKRLLFTAGASAIAMSLSASPATAQEDDSNPRTLGTVLVTTQKSQESIQDVPIAVSAFDEESLEKLQLAAGPDLVKSIPNVSASKTNFTGFNFKIRGIGNDAVAQSSDAGVGVHQNDVPLTVNRLFEAEFFDVERVETLRGPQGTLYGRNATGGVVNVITAKPVLEEFQANARLTAGNYNTLKAKGMVNIPIGDTAALRLAGSWLQRDGYVDNVVSGNDIDDRELFGIRGTFAWEPTDRLRTWVSVEHFKEDDTRLRSGKQLCSKDPFKDSFQGIPIAAADQLVTTLGCVEAPLDQSFDRVNSAAGINGGFASLVGLLTGDAFTDPLIRDLRTIEADFDPIYEAESTLVTANVQFDLTDQLTATYLTSYLEDEILSIEDFNKSTPNVAFNDLSAIPAGVDPLVDIYNALFPGGVVNDPQLGASNLFRTYDLSGHTAEQMTHELRLQSEFSGPFNFNVGAIYVDFEIGDAQNPNDGYSAFSNALTAVTQLHNALVGASIPGGFLGFDATVPVDTAGNGASLFEGAVTGLGGNYFRTISPYRLESFALFGESYIDLSDDLQLTVGLRYTDDKKEQDIVPTYLFTPEIAYAGPPQNGDPRNPIGVQEAQFEEVTGRIGLDWSPDLSWSDDTLLYGFYSRGYKGGGINPPQPAGAELFPATFEPEFIDAFEVGTKNTFSDGSLQLNANAFLYDYQGYQITQIVNRTSVNFNVDAELKGLELETVWNPASTLLLSANLGLLDTEVKDTFGIDVLDRTAGNSDFVVIKNALTYANCVVSAQAYGTVLAAIQGGLLPEGATQGICLGSFAGQEALFGLPTGSLTPRASDAAEVISGNEDPLTYGVGNGFAQDLSGNAIPNAPETTLSIGAEYTWQGLFGGAWELTTRGDYYYQADSFSRVWNSQRDRLDSWDNINVAVVLANIDDDLTIEFFGKNITDEEVITGTFLADDSQGLFSNIFLTEPRTYGVTVSKRW